VIGLESGDVDAVECDRAAGDRILADHRAQQAGLADAVAAEHAHHLARLGRDRDPAQRLGRAVIEVDVLYLEHGFSVPDTLRSPAHSTKPDRWFLRPALSLRANRSP